MKTSRSNGSTKLCNASETSLILLVKSSCINSGKDTGLRTLSSGLNRPQIPLNYCMLTYLSSRWRRWKYTSHEPKVIEKLKSTILQHFYSITLQEALVYLHHTHHHGSAEVLEDVPINGVATNTADFMAEGEQERHDISRCLWRNVDDRRYLFPTLCFFRYGHFTPDLEMWVRSLSLPPLRPKHRYLPPSLSPYLTLDLKMWFILPHTHTEGLVWYPMDHTLSNLKLKKACGYWKWRPVYNPGR